MKPEVKKMKKIKTLAIAPYNGLKDLIQELAKESEILEVHAFVADMLDGVEIVKSIQDKSYDAIISRAGTADLIREISDLPVIDIKLSIIDMMSAIKLAQNYPGKFFVVGFKSITDVANVICQLNDYDVEIKTISDISEIGGCLTDLKATGVSLIVGDVVTINHAKKIGLNTILVTSGRESVLSSFDEVIKIHKLLQTTQRKNLLVKDILENSDVSVVCFNMNKQIIYSNISEDIEEYKKILEELENLIEELIKEKRFKISKKIGSNFILIKGEKLEFNDSFYLTFYIENQQTAIKPFDHAVSYINVSDAPQINFETIFTSSELFKKVIEDAKAFSTTQAPIIIIGDMGTGKDTLAHAIYQNSNYNKNPLVVIDAEYMNEKKWASIFESENSLFTNSDFTIYIKNLHLMNEKSQNLFESYFLNTYVYKRNRFIFSCISGFSKSFEESTILTFIKNKLTALPLIMPNLSQRKEDIPSLASLFLSDLNLIYGKQVIGLENEAMKLLQDFTWTTNIKQLKRVIKELIIITDTFYISEESVNRVLSYENLPKSSSYTQYLDLNKRLDEINRDIINSVLSEENFNQSRAAERLGISRSTLWRKIK